MFYFMLKVLCDMGKWLHKKERKSPKKQLDLEAFLPF